jgi:membrane protease YdiL (CAAX protease family)
MIIPMSLIFAAAIVGYHKIEGGPLSWSAFGQRMRFPRLRFKDLALGFGLFVLVTFAYGAAGQVGVALIERGLIPIPNGVPALVDPRISFDLAALDRLAGGSLLGRWELVALYLVMFFFNIVGEELWWRGYILPRQELAHRRLTWLLHGLLWTGFHVYKWWDMIGLLPVCLILSFAAQKTRNNWPVLIAHGLTNGMALILVIAAAAGLL